MNVKELKERMQLLEDMGFGDSEVLAYDPEIEECAPVTGMIYGKGMPVELFTDEQ